MYFCFPFLKVKAAFTRTYNKMGPVLPFAPQANVSKKKGVSHDDLYGEEEDGVESNPEEDEDVEKDALIKVCSHIFFFMLCDKWCYSRRKKQQLKLKRMKIQKHLRKLVR